jgi:hypothetical protein
LDFLFISVWHNEIFGDFTAQNFISMSKSNVILDELVDDIG